MTASRPGRSRILISIGSSSVASTERALGKGHSIAHSAVFECTVVGEQDADGLVKPHAFVAPRPGVATEGLADVVRDFAKERLEAYKCPRWITFLAELPRTATERSDVTF